MKKSIIPILFIVVISLTLYLVSRRFSEDEIIVFVNNAGLLAPAVYILLVLLTMVIAPFSGTPIIFAGYYAFGQRVILYSTIAAWISFVINFWIARKWGRAMVIRLAGKDAMKKIDDLTLSYGTVTLVLLRMFQGSISDFVSFAMGLTNINFKIYLFISLTASIPGTILWYFLSLNANTPAQFTIIMLVFTLTLSFIFVAGSIFWKKFLKK
ncbi:MAG TPA: VTT domain-containing protein [Patescibacteria group bacterium]|nr:VTT domain-containing protein [Patescibacteria group bacterium]